MTESSATAPLAPRPEALKDIIASLFGRRPDGTYSLPTTGKMDDDPDRLEALIGECSEGGVIGGPKMDLNWIEERAEAIRAFVDDEIYNLEAYAHQHGLVHIEETYLEQCIRLGVLTTIEDFEDELRAEGKL